MVGKVGKVGKANKAGYIWSTVHGLAGVMNGQSIGELALKANVLKRAVRHSMQRMNRACRQDVMCKVEPGFAASRNSFGDRTSWTAGRSGERRLPSKMLTFTSDARVSTKGHWLLSTSALWRLEPLVPTARRGRLHALRVVRLS